MSRDQCTADSENHVKSNATPAVEASGLFKSFGRTRAVDDVDLCVQSGRVYGFLGPNGAGKTTTIRILATLLRPDQGEARVFGYDVVRQADEVRQRVGLTGQFASLDEDLTGFENIVMLARLRGYSWSQAKRRANDLLEFFELEESAKRLVKTYSGGMRRRADIAASLVTTPDLLFLDEPTTGLDPRNRNQIWDIIRELVADNITVFLTTQYLDEADALADRIAVIDNGKIIAEGTSGELKARVGQGALHLRLEDPEKRPEAESFLSERLGLSVYLDSDPAELAARLSSPEDASGVLVQLTEAGLRVSSFSFGQPSLDEVFLTLTGHAAETVAEEDQ
jgi:ABC-2 type transport system ATP-binding protein